MRCTVGCRCGGTCINKGLTCSKTPTNCPKRCQSASSSRKCKLGCLCGRACINKGYRCSKTPTTCRKKGTPCGPGPTAGTTPTPGSFPAGGVPPPPPPPAPGSGSTPGGGSSPFPGSGSSSTPAPAPGGSFNFDDIFEESTSGTNDPGSDGVPGGGIPFNPDAPFDMPMPDIPEEDIPSDIPGPNPADDFSEATCDFSTASEPSIEGGVPGDTCNQKIIDLAVSNEFDLANAKTLYRRGALKCHPDKGGNQQEFNCLSYHYDVRRYFGGEIDVEEIGTVDRACEFIGTTDNGGPSRYAL
jgi:hypothetical protein